jgi:hypothetical protein
MMIYPSEETALREPVNDSWVGEIKAKAQPPYIPHCEVVQ